MPRNLYLVAYDVRHPTRLQRALYVLKDYACAGQKSVFECWLTLHEKKQLQQRLQAELDLDSDSVVLSRLKKTHPVRTLGIAPEPEDTPFVYLG